MSSKKKSSYHSRAGSFVKPYQPSVRPFSPAKIEKEDQPVQLTKYKS